MGNDFRYRSLSSIGRELLPKAKRLHGRGMSWGDVADMLGVSRSSIFN